jgi:hypothetical protein
VRQLPLFPSPPRPPVKPVVKKALKSVSYTAMKNSRQKCDDCLHVLILARGKAPVARMAKWKARSPDGEIHVLCAAHKHERVDVDEGSLR